MGRLLRTFAKLAGLSGSASRVTALESQRFDRLRQQWVKARFDAAVTTNENQRHWANADYLSADAAATPDVRRILRARSRYEAANNSYARGIVLSLANACIGTGPRLQLLTEDKDVNTLVNREFAKWSRSIGLAEKLRTMRAAKAVDGEAFAVLTTNRGLSSAVLLDVALVEADRVTGVYNTTFDLEAQLADGIEFDEYRNPVRYQVLIKHPGSPSSVNGESRSYEAERVIHLFRVDRPGQIRGLPELMPALPLFAQLRRYTLATLSAAEIAAMFSAVLKTTLPADDSGEETGGTAFDSFDIERGMMTTLPEGAEMQQFTPEQPTTTYPQFKAEIINEIARALCIPYNIAAGNSSSYNYASGRLDHQDFDLAIRVERRQLECCVLDRIFSEWLEEAALAGVVPASLLEDSIAKDWRWDGRDHVDPTKDANAQETRLKSSTTTLAIEYARQGLDWEEQIRQRAREIALMRSLEIPLATDAPAMVEEDEEALDE